MFRITMILGLLWSTSVALAAEPIKLEVLVVPFTMLDNNAKQAWIGRAIQQNLQAELGQQPDLQIVGSITLQEQKPNVLAMRSPSEPTILDDNAAIALGKSASADLVIFGSFQIVGDDLRITGKMLDVTNKRIIGHLKATGPQAQLLNIEDALANQALALLGYSTAEAMDDASSEPTLAQGPVIQEPLEPSTGSDLEPAYFDPSNAYGNVFGDYSYGYTPSYVFPYTYIYYPVFVPDPDNHFPRRHWRHWHDRDRDHDRGRGPRFNDDNDVRRITRVPPIRRGSDQDLPQPPRMRRDSSVGVRPLGPEPRTDAPNQPRNPDRPNSPRTRSTEPQSPTQPKPNPVERRRITRALDRPAGGVLSTRFEARGDFTSGFFASGALPRLKTRRSLTPGFFASRGLARLKARRSLTPGFFAS
ncbi:MAG TPA: hypothetical protein VHP11_10045, partial [Tepidisphaeraceae bacterium]|nr:hypothetical protein [Tepidisphaeraceae bacterium]